MRCAAMIDETIREANAWNTTDLIDLYMDAREKYLRGIVDDRPDQVKFLKGWLNRTASVRKTAKADVNKAKEPPPPTVMPKAVPPPPPPPPPAKEAIKEEVAEAVKSPTNAIGVGFLLTIFEWIFGWVGWLYGLIPEMSTEVKTATEPLKALGEATQINLLKFAAPIAIAATLTVLYRNWMRKRQAKKLAAQLKEMTDGEVQALV
jgi:hypothetical protein